MNFLLLHGPIFVIKIDENASKFHKFENSLLLYCKIETQELITNDPNSRGDYVIQSKLYEVILKCVKCSKSIEGENFTYSSNFVCGV